jgi:hypothetical protein
MLGAPSIVPGIIAIIGGIHALERKRWGLALAGSIFALFGPAGFLLIFGLLAVKYADMVPGLQPPPDNRHLLFIFVHRFQPWFRDSWDTRHHIRHHGEARIQVKPKIQIGQRHVSESQEGGMPFGLGDGLTPTPGLGSGQS